MAQAQRPSTIYRSGGTIRNLVGTTSFEAIMFIKEGQTYSHCFVSSNSFHGQITQKAVHQITDLENKKM